MRIRKFLPKDKIDKRLIYPVDELRVKFWLSKVMEKTGCSTSYSLSKHFGGNQTKWKNYKFGGQPNDDLLDEVDAIVHGSKNWYTRGPDELTLWASLATETELEKLKVIAKVSKNIDGKIAQLRADAINCEVIGREGAYPNIIFEAFDLRLSEIKSDLDKLMNEELVQKAVEILRTNVQPQIDELCSKSNDDLYDFILDSKYQRSDYIKMQDEQEYAELELSTVQKKGKRKVNI